jgi:hypothetical protein
MGAVRVIAKLEPKTRMATTKTRKRGEAGLGRTHQARSKGGGGPPLLKGNEGNRAHEYRLVVNRTHQDSLDPQAESKGGDMLLFSRRLFFLRSFFPCRDLTCPAISGDIISGLGMVSLPRCKHEQLRPFLVGCSISSINVGCTVRVDAADSCNQLLIWKRKLTGLKLKACPLFDQIGQLKACLLFDQIGSNRGSSPLGPWHTELRGAVAVA